MRYYVGIDVGAVSATAALIATETHDSAEEDFGDVMREVLDPGADVLVECSGQARVLEEAFSSMIFAGRILLLGACLESVNLNPATLLVREIAFQSSYGCDMEEMRECIDAVGSGRIDIDPVISGVVSQDELSEAFERLCGPNDEVKLVMEIQ